MHKLLYVSVTKQAFPESELREIFENARANNRDLGITGLLLYVDGGFLQVLEGEADDIHSLYRTIAKDPRHWNVRVLFDEPAPRNFGAWSMGYKYLTESDDPGVVGVTRAAVDGLIKPGGAKVVMDVLIHTFQTVQGAP